MLSNHIIPTLSFPTGLHNVINRSGTECDPSGVNIGPTQVDFSMLPVVAAPISEKERKLLKQWKNQDLSSFYRQQRSNRW